MLSIYDILKISSLMIIGENDAGKKALAASLIDHIDNVTTER
jgi:hypothetical protein